MLLEWLYSHLGVGVADNTKLLLLGAAGAAVWWFYIRKPAPTASASDTSKPADTSVAPKAPSIADIQAAVILSAKAPSEGLTVDEWGWYLNNALAPLGKAAPDPMPLFSQLVDAANQAMAASSRVNNVPFTPQAFTRSTRVTAATYWPVMTQALKSQLGLSGLGMYGWVQ